MPKSYWPDKVYGAPGSHAWGQGGGAAFVWPWGRGRDVPGAMPQPPGSPFGPRRRVLPRVLIVAGSMALAVVIAASQIDVPYFALRPGSVLDGGAAVEIEGLPTYDAAGTVHFTTVSIRQTTALDWVLAHFDGDVDLTHRDEILGDRDPEENRQRNLEMMEHSQLIAPTVALEKLGLDVETSIRGVVVTGIMEDMPAEGTLEPGDVIVELDGVPLDELGTLETVMDGQSPGGEVDVVVLPVDEARHPEDAPQERATTCSAEEAELSEARASLEPDERAELERVEAAQEVVGERLDAALQDPDQLEARTVGLAVLPADEETGHSEGEPDRPMMGIGVAPYGLEYEFPVDICFETGQIGGPSAGLAFTLTLIDLLSPGDLTGGLDVAVTGSIGADGSVGSVGGTGQKAAAAHRDGMDAFLVPASGRDYDNAQDHAREVEVVPVATLDEALAALERLGGDPLEMP